MSLNSRILRRLFAGGAVFVVLVVCGFYVNGIVKMRRVIRSIPAKIAADLVQSTTGFTFSKSEGGRTLFTIHAARAQQFKEGGRAKLFDVNITIYGRESRRFDQIYGTDFEYDQRTGDVVARGEVHIDLESDSSGVPHPDQAPPQEMKNPIHLKTSGLTFNQKTGFAETHERIEFRIPEAVGSAVGATYDSKSNLLELKSAVRVTTTEKQKAVITAQSALFSKNPRRADLLGCRVEQPSRSLQADKITLLIRDDNTLERVLASGNVHIEDSGPKGFEAKAPRGEVVMGSNQQMKNGALSGGVVFESRGPSAGKGTAGRLLFDFTGKSELTKARAEDSVTFLQSASLNSIALKSDAVDLLAAKGGRRLDQAVTSGAAQITRTEGATRYLITAGVFRGKFNAQNRLSGVTGNTDARVVASTPGQPDRISTSRELVASFDAKGAISLMEQRGEFHYQEGQRTATAETARLLPADDRIELTGSPRVVDSGATLTAQSIQLSRKANTAFAQGQVKATYSDLKQQPGGGMLSSADPIHVTGSSMVASRN
ncbi:MAG TPA: LPS export ABC transporter periplasmic protein LptC, partial [Candidatus Saccharimonadales bacterium]|nr:LPS export ABC transporter periplasmic protein LptC [Candidatus Saccharimonadales bacterium]